MSFFSLHRDITVQKELSNFCMGAGFYSVGKLNGLVPGLFAYYLAKMVKKLRYKKKIYYMFIFERT